MAIDKKYLVTIYYGHDKERKLLVNDDEKNVLNKAFTIKKSVEIELFGGKEVLVNMEFAQEIEFRPLGEEQLVDKSVLVNHVRILE